MEEDKILLQGMVFFGYHGNTEEERKRGQPFIVDVELRYGLARAGRSDQLEHTLDYGKAYQVVRDVLEGRSHQLLEALAESVAARLLAELPAEAVVVRVKKPHVALPGPLEYAGVEIARKRAANSTAR